MSAAKNLSIRLAAVGGDKVRQEFKALGNDGQKAFRQITNVITPANDNLLKLNENTKVFNNILRQASYVAGAFLGFKGISGTLGALFESNRNFEQLSASLKTVIGSTENAQAAFTLIENFATATPYQLNEVVEAFIRLKALGLDPSEEALTSYGNTASAFSKNILDFVEAVADATVGEFERLKSFGIKANTLTNEVKFTFAGVTTTVKKNATDMVAAYYTGGIVAGAYGAFAGAAAATAISVGGSMLVNAVIPSPYSSLTSSYSASSLESSPTYSLNAQGNQAKLGGVIPVLYGRHIIYPDFAAKPYTEYNENEQYLHQLHVLTQGYCEVEQIRIDDTLISSFAEVEYEIVQPNQPVTLFNPNVVMAAEIAGQELLKDTYVGGFIVNPEDTQIDKIGIDVVMSAGLYYANDSGGLSSKTIQWKAEARLVDDEGNALGDWIVLGSESHTAAQNTPIRLTFFYMVSLGRYEVRMVRLDAKDTSARAAHAIYWESLKGYMEAPSDFGEMTLLAIKMRATNNLSSNSSRKINAIVNRKVKTWSSNSGWSEPVKTRSIAWAIADILTAPYGGKLSDERIHLTELEQLDKVWESRGDYFDGIFDSTTTIWEAMLKVARCGRAIPILQAGMIRIIRDDKKTIPTAMFTPRNIVKDSFSIEYIMPSEDTADSVKVQYFSSKYWKYDDVTTKLADSTEENPANVDLFGCTNKEHAAREGYYMCACNRYRRKYISFQTELEGLIPTYGDLISITHDMCEWGQGGEVLSVSGNTLKLSEHLMWKENEEHFICFRHKDGSMSETYPVIRGAVDEEAVIQTVPDIKIYTGTAMERTHFTFGIKGKVSMYAKVIGVKPRGDTVEISCVNESDEVYKT